MKRALLFTLSMLHFLFSFAQHSLTGTVRDLQGNPLFGANVILENTFYGTASGMDGHFSFKNLQNGDYLLKVSYLGFKPKIEKINLIYDKILEISLEPNEMVADEVIVLSTRASEKSPVSFTNVDKSVIEKRNLGQDVPYILNLTPSFVSTSDAGTGIGYTNFRIRGTDLNRINVTINGIPLNDSESHGVWWVDLPDFSSSTQNIQIQRGIGTSTNGAGAFGATINLQTNGINKKAYAELSESYGSFNTLKTTFSMGSGLINDHFSFDARYSKINSEGFIDRAAVNLESYFVSGSYYDKKNLVKLNVFSGIEDTYQAWTGVPKVRLENDIKGMLRYQEHGLYTQEQTQHMMESDNRTYNYYTYKNEIDHYKQSHYQLIYSHEFNQDLHANIALHYTKGAGYYEQHRDNDDFADYKLPELITGSDTILSTELIRRKWLDNDFFGITYSLNYKKGRMDFSAGGGWNNYDGNHFGRIVWAKFAGSGNFDHEWYRSTGDKKDFNTYAKMNYQILDGLSFYGDFQIRTIDYKIKGIDDDLRNISQTHTFLFFNPKGGVFYSFNNQQNMYFSVAVGNREPNRDNFIDADPSKPRPTSERMMDYEFGYSFKTRNLSVGLDFYNMDYKNQLVLTGKINDVGDPVMTNVSRSYRRGIELMIGIRPVEKLKWDFNCTLSQNKIKRFTEYVDNWDTWGQTENDLEETDLSFSPNMVMNSQLSYEITDNLSISLSSKMVGKQYIDNTSSEERRLDPYFVNDFLLSYTIKTKLVKEIVLSLMVNNLFNEQYETNAWVYRYLYEGKQYAMDGYFPQAGIHFLAGLTIKL